MEKYTKKNQGFTLIELLIVVGIIALLAVLIIPALSKSRLLAKDAAVAATLSTFRNDAELAFEGNFIDICDSELFYELVNRVEGYRGEIGGCESDGDNFRVLAIMPSVVAELASNEGSEFVKTAYAQDYAIPAGEGPESFYGPQDIDMMRQVGPFNGYCINSSGVSSPVRFANVPGVDQSLILATSRLKHVGNVETKDAAVVEELGAGEEVSPRGALSLTKQAYAQTEALQVLDIKTQTQTVTHANTNTSSDMSNVISFPKDNISIVRSVGGASLTGDYYCTYEEKAADLKMDVNDVIQMSLEQSQRVAATRLRG
ncbi:MAG: prepilin-type N-terminal cleavage/methylation domain-containing protein [Candidatus Pacebacteria bacterium]|nr:prepilin-type N-terminal cleavage/methylation domain-containing protein [Candidatus Paceibacterota bacterium]